MPMQHLPHTMPLKEFAKFFRIDPFHFFGFCLCEDGNQIITEGCRCQCGDRWLEYQSDSRKTTREAVSLALFEAENALMRFLGFAIAPTEFRDIEIEYPTISAYLNSSSWSYDGKSWFRKDGTWKTVFVPDGAYIKEVGVRVCGDPIEGTVTVNVPITYREQTFQITAILPVGTSPQDVRVCHALSNRFDDPDFANWQLNYNSITIDPNTGNTTILMPAYLLGQPALTHNPSDCLDRDNEDSYVTEVEIRICVLDPCQQGTAYGIEGDCTTPPCDELEQAICGQIKNKNAGELVIKPVECLVENQSIQLNVIACPSFVPTRIVLNYGAGYPLSNGKIHPALYAATLDLAASYLACELPSCQCKECMYKQIGELRKVYSAKVSEGALEGMAGDTYQVLIDKNKPYPLGVRWGAVMAFDKVKKMRKL